MRRFSARVAGERYLPLRQCAGNNGRGRRSWHEWKILMLIPFHSQALFTLDQLEAIEETTKRILAEVGIGVRNPWLLERLPQMGYTVTPDGRVRIEASVVTRFLEET